MARVGHGQRQPSAAPEQRHGRRGELLVGLERRVHQPRVDLGVFRNGFVAQECGSLFAVDGQLQVVDGPEVVRVRKRVVSRDPRVAEIVDDGIGGRAAAKGKQRTIRIEADGAGGEHAAGGRAVAARTPGRRPAASGHSRPSPRGHRARCRSPPASAAARATRRRTRARRRAPGRACRSSPRARRCRVRSRSCRPSPLRSAWSCRRPVR